LELKPGAQLTAAVNQRANFNRTTLELKPISKRKEAGKYLYFNRTTLELKLYLGDVIDTSSNILIVPLWN